MQSPSRCPLKNPAMVCFLSLTGITGLAIQALTSRACEKKSMSTCICGYTCSFWEYSSARS